jgi:hypothetical protein
MAKSARFTLTGHTPISSTANRLQGHYHTR